MFIDFKRMKGKEMNKIFMSLALVLTLCSCDEKALTTIQNVDQEFEMNCAGAVTGTMNVMFYRCENKEAICYLSYNGNSIDCRWKGE